MASDIQTKKKNPWSILDGCCVTIACTVLISVIFGIVYVCVIVYRIENGLNAKGAYAKTHKAMLNGDGARAIFWSKKNYAYEILGKAGQFHDSEYRIAQAYELDGQLEKSLHWYEIHGDGKLPDRDAARLFYKLGRHKESFEAYCASATQWDLENHNRRKLFHDLVMGLPYEHLCPFPTYAEFVTYMESEYEKLGRPEAYREAMERIRQIQQEDVNDTR